MKKHPSNASLLFGPASSFYCCSSHPWVSSLWYLSDPSGIYFLPRQFASKLNIRIQNTAPPFDGIIALAERRLRGKLSWTDSLLPLFSRSLLDLLISFSTEYFCSCFTVMKSHLAEDRLYLWLCVSHTWEIILSIYWSDLHKNRRRFLWSSNDEL